MKKSIILGSATACLSLFLGGPLHAADGVPSAQSENPIAGLGSALRSDSSETCLTSLSAFESKIDSEGLWLGGSSFGIGYPAGGWGLGYGYSAGNYRPPFGIGYQNARPGYEIRSLLASAIILARLGETQSCEDVLRSANLVYDRYAKGMNGARAELSAGPLWRQDQIAAAQPVGDRMASFRSDQLIGTEVRNEQDASLGSIDDLVMSPETGKIAYLVVARGGIFGIDQTYVPVPWGAFKATPNMNMLVLQSSKATMDGAPAVKHDQVLSPAEYTDTSRKVDSYWKTHLAAN